MSLTHSPAQSTPAAGQSSKSLKAVVFTIADYLLALPLDAVLKVVNCPPQICHSTNSIELFHLGHHSITVLNLQHHFAARPVNQSLSNDQFLVITQSQEDLCAILVDTPPDLVELPQSVIRTLPQSYRQGQLLNFASHVAVLSRPEANLSIFLLNVDQAIETVRRKA